MPTEKVIDSFLTQSDEQAVFHIHEIQQCVSHSSLSSNGSVRNSTRFETSQGYPVNQVDENTFEILWPHMERNEIVRKI
jgi:hypothetical protein